jgi:hypothetical protein
MKKDEMSSDDFPPMEALPPKKKAEPPPNEGPLLNAHEVLQLHYNGRITLTPLQVRSASAAIGFEKPKLAAVATFNSRDDFGTQLERAIAASDAVREPRLIEGKVLGEGSKANGHHSSPEEVSSAKMSAGFSSLRRRA